MIRDLLERIAPHEPAEDQVAPYGTPDVRTFTERLHDADMRRNENPNTLWATRYYERRKVQASVDTCWQLTHWGLGIDSQWQHGGAKGRLHGFPSRVDTLLTLGPWSVSLSIEWNYPVKYP